MKDEMRIRFGLILTAPKAYGRSYKITVRTKSYTSTVLVNPIVDRSISQNQQMKAGNQTLSKGSEN